MSRPPDHIVAEVSRFLWDHWDPIGVNPGVPYVPNQRASVQTEDCVWTDEYDSYAQGVATLLWDGADAVKIAARLNDITHASMGLQRPKGGEVMTAKELINRFGNRE